MVLGLPVLSPVFPVTSSATVMMRRSLLQLALYSVCKPRVYVPFRAPSAPSPCTHSRDNGTGTTKPQGCDVALCVMQLSQFVSFARGAQCRVARHVALRLLLKIEGSSKIIMISLGTSPWYQCSKKIFFWSEWSGKERLFLLSFFYK